MSLELVRRPVTPAPPCVFPTNLKNTSKAIRKSRMPLRQLRARIRICQPMQAYRSLRGDTTELSPFHVATP